MSRLPPEMGFTKRSNTWCRYCLQVLICIGLIAVGCSGHVQEKTKVGNGEAPANDPILQRYAALKAQAEEVVPPETLLPEITKVVVDGGLAHDEASAVAYVIDRYRDHEVGRAITQAYLSRLLNEGEEKAITYSRNLIDKHGDAPTAACAFDFLLERLQNQSQDAYLSACETAIQGNQKRLKCVALLSRINFYYEGEKTKLAALDTLRFWRLYPEKVESVHLKPFFCGNLERAGWLLEADIMSHSSRAAEDAGLLLDSLDAIGVEAALKTGAAQTALQALFLSAPDTARILDAANAATLTTGQRANVLLHCSRLELSNTNGSRTLPLIAEYLKIVDAIVLEKKGDLSQLRLLNQAAARAVSEYIKIHEETKSFSLNVPGARQIRELTEALNRLAKNQISLCQDQLSEGTSAAYSIETMSAFFEEINTPWVNAAMLEAFIASNPGQPNVTSLKMKLAELQRDKLEQPQKAAETFLQVFKDAPDSAEATRAAILGCIVLVQEAHHEAALTHLQELETVLSKQDADYPLVLYLMGLCEHSLGFKEDGEARITELLLNYPGSRVSAKALLWLGSVKLADQQYQEARSHFQDLIERYPTSPEAEPAKHYVARMANLPEDAP